MSQKEGKRWIVKDALGRISGPFSTEKVLHQIKRGELMGEEQISLYPSGQWIQISKDPVFYDKLLDVLSQQGLSEPENEKTQEELLTVKVDDQSSSQKKKVIKNKEELLEELDLEEVPGIEQEKPQRESRKGKKGKKEEEHEVLELVSVKGLIIKQALRKSVWVIAASLVAVVILFYAFSGKDHRENRVRLIAPATSTQKSESSAPDLVKKALSGFLPDTFEGYIRAQSQFVQSLEANEKQPEVFALLCMTYLELWPFAYQDSTDMKVISSVVQRSSALDPGGQSSATCRAIDLIVRGRYQEAKNLSESMLENQGANAKPPILFYYLKGYLLEGAGEFAPAIGYFRSAEQLWPQWIKPFFHEAVALIKVDRNNEAANVLRKVIQANSKHAKAKLELGLIEYKFLNHVDVGQRFLESALQGESRLSPPMKSRGYLGLAEIALKKGNQRDALKYAKLSYRYSSTNTVAQNMVVQLGGGLDKSNVDGQQLLYEGDQFFREGDFNSAQAHYRAAFEKNNKNAVAAMKAAKCFWELSFSTEAFEWLNKAIRADSKLIEAYVLMADYYTQRFNFLAASKILSKAQRVSPKNPEVYRGFALVELRRGNPAGAITFGKKSIELYEINVETHILMSEAYIAAGDHRLAYNYAAKAIEIDVNNRHAQTVYAKALGGVQGTEAAIDYLNKLVSSYPLVKEYRLSLAQLLTEDERFDQAESVFNQIIKMEDKPKEALLGLASIQKLEGRAKEALESLLQAAVMDPADAEPIFEAGMIYLDAKKPKLALAQFQRVERINKLYPRIHYQIGLAYLQMGDLKKVLEETRLEKGMNPNLADSYLLAAEAYLGLKQYSLCASEYQQAIKLRPQSATIYVKMAQCYRRAGNLDAAMAMLTQAATQESGLADIYKEQGAIYETKGEVNLAIESYNQYFVLDPNAPDRSQIEQRIMSLQGAGAHSE